MTPAPVVTPPQGNVVSTQPVVTLGNMSGGFGNDLGGVALAGSGLAGGGIGLGGGLGNGLGGGTGGTSAGGSAVVPLTTALSAPGDTGFRVSVIQSGTTGAVGDTIVVARPIGTIDVAQGRFSYTVPVDAFAVSNPNMAVSLSVTQINGAALPGWLRFNPATATFEGTPPPGVRDVQIRVIARDRNGHEAVQVIRLQIGATRTGDINDGGAEPKAAFTGRSSLSSQLAAAQGGHSERMAGLVRSLSGRNAKVA